MKLLKKTNILKLYPKQISNHVIMHPFHNIWKCWFTLLV